MNFQSDKDVLAQLYGTDSKDLDHTDKFLRDFILKEGWKQKNDDDNYKKYQEKVDMEDEDRDSDYDRFEQQYNFRFEEKNAAYLTTHQR